MKKLLFLLSVIALMGSTACNSDDSMDEIASEAIITPQVGLGDITFQDDGNKVMEVYGMYNHLSANRNLSDAAFAMWYDIGLGFQLDYIDTQGLSLQEVADMSSDLIDLNQKIITIVVMSPFKAETKEGLGIGSSKEEIVATYGEPDKVFSSTEDYESLGLKFTYNAEDKVRRIDLYR